jgi:amino acid transporter
LRRELGVLDLALTQILFIIGMSWVGVAAKLGPSHVVFWLLAAILFYVPSALVVIYLNRLMPLEGGLYQWAKLGFSEFTGFLVAWNLWLYAILLTSMVGIDAATILSYALGPGAEWLAGSKWFMVLASCLLLGTLALVAIRGLNVGKWVHNAGGFLMIAIFTALVALLAINWARGVQPASHWFQASLPALSLLNVNILGKMGFGALGGFEYVAILAGECRDPVRTIRRSVLIAAPAVALMFILGTGAMLSLVRPGDIDLIGPIPQALSLGARSLGIATRIAPLVILSILGLHIAQRSVNLTATARLPMVAGWDHLLPKWFTRLHPKHRTPVNSILFLSVLIFMFGVASLIGVGQQEAFQLLNNASGIFYALTYLVMFAIPLVGLRHLQPRAPWWLRMAAASGFLMTLLYVTLSIFPIIRVESVASFTAKIVAVIAGANAIGAGIFWLADRK